MTRYTHRQPDAIKPIKNYIKMNTHTKKYTHTTKCNVVNPF